MPEGFSDYPRDIVESRDISYPEPEPCELCFGMGRLDFTPCCGLPFVETEDAHGYRCFRCKAPYSSRKCPECQGEGVKE